MTERNSTLVIDLQPGQSLVMGDGVCVQLVHKSGRIARMRVTAPLDIKIEKKATDVADLVPRMAESSLS